MLSFDVLNPLITSAFTHELTWLEASERFPLNEFVETFYSTRAHLAEALEAMTDEQVAFASAAHSMWSVSESITHLIYSQGFYLNKLLDIATSALPHAVEAARGFGEGARTHIPADDLRQRLFFATEQITAALEGTRFAHDPDRTEVNEFFGVCNYRTWVLLLLSHEVDHLRQVVAMRRLASAEGI